MNWEAVEWSIIGPALFAGLLILSIHVPLGHRVLTRGIIFIDLAIAQIAGLGVIAAEVMFEVDHGWVVQLAAVSAALLAAIGLNWSEKHWPETQEALIGTLFVLAATGSILLLAENPHGGEHLKDLLVGQILWSTWSSLLPIAGLYLVLGGIWLMFPAFMQRMGFYLVFAFVVTASVQVVGVYLVFASLIIPALATLKLPETKGLIVGYAIGSAGYLAGIILSAVLDLPTGAIIVWCMAIIGLVVGQYFGRRIKTAATSQTE
ncbi:MAG: metal ABC transporter permease [Gammaproteobacteria bacterium]|jgi:zinc/manganese transport system permease protein|nr:metal ABC transporter permease [Gammaproteobacteria bacterium]